LDAFDGISFSDLTLDPAGKPPEMERGVMTEARSMENIRRGSVLAAMDFALQEHVRGETKSASGGRRASIASFAKLQGSMPLPPPASMYGYMEV
jgi:hypothetical protein